MDKIVLVWCAQSGKNLGALKGHTQPVTCLCWQPLHVAEGDSFPLLATSSKDAAVRIWAALMQSAIIKLCAWNCQTCKLFWCVCISHRTLLWEMVSYQLVSPTFWISKDTSVGTCLRSLTSHSQPVMQIRWSGERPDIGGVVYSAGRDCVIKVWNPKDGAMLIPGFRE